MLLKNEIDKEKQIFNNKEKQLKECIRQLEDKLSQEMLSNSEAMQETSHQHTLELRKTNEEIERLKKAEARMEEQRIKT